MNNSDVCEAFFRGNNAIGANLASRENKLFSFDTCIAQWDASYLILNKTKYSRSTSAHQRIISDIAKDNMLSMYIIEIDNVPTDESSLLNYI